MQIDSENLSSLFIFGGGGGVALWLTSAVVGAIDSIPLVGSSTLLIFLDLDPIWYITFDILHC